MENECKNSEKTINSIKRYIKTVLKENGQNDSTLSYQIDLVASDIVIYRKIRSSVLSLEELTVVETSREGHSRKRAHPLLFDYREQSRRVQDGLDKLTMNIKSKKGKKAADNVMEKFMEMMNEDDD